jgi:hypothetical protein
VKEKERWKGELERKKKKKKKKRRKLNKTECEGEVITHSAPTVVRQLPRAYSVFKSLALSVELHQCSLDWETMLEASSES